jgi:hypothetical protein
MMMRTHPRTGAVAVVLSAERFRFSPGAPQLTMPMKFARGDALFVSFPQSKGFAGTPGSKAIEADRQKG